MQTFLKENGYVWESGIAGHYTYGPFGKSLKNNIENFIRRIFEKESFIEIESPIILHKNVWLNSGHWDKFRDPMIKTQDGRLLRLDHLIEKYFPNENYSKLNNRQVYQLLIIYNTQICKEEVDKIAIPYLEEHFEIEFRDLMMKSYSGNNEVGLRPETATATFNNFLDLYNFCNNQLPICVYQIGKSFRNEISPRHGIIRGREFTQAEFQIILKESQKYNRSISSLITNINTINETLSAIDWLSLYGLEKSEYGYYILLTYEIFLKLGIPMDKIRLRQHDENERAFYALDAWDIEVNLNDLGWTEIAGLHDRGSYDLRNCKFKSKTPHIIEIAIGIDRLFYSILDSLYEKHEIKEGKPILKIPYNLASVQVSVLPLVKNNKEIVNKSNMIYDSLKYKFKCETNKNGYIGTRYLKNAIKGIPYSITIDYETLKDESVTIRDRDTEEQERIMIKDLIDYLSYKLYE